MEPNWWGLGHKFIDNFIDERLTTRKDELNSRLEAARKRVGDTPTACLKWVLDFIQRDLDALSSGVRLDLSDELLAFALPRQEPDPFPLDKTLLLWAVTSFPDEDIRALQRDLLAGIRQLLGGEVWYIQFATPPDSRHFAYVMERDARGRASGYYVGDYHSCMLMRAADLLKAAGERLRECVECQRLFLAVKRQAYCGPQCSQKARTRRFLAAHQKTLSERRHSTYEKKVRTKLPGARVGRRTRVHSKAGS